MRRLSFDLDPQHLPIARGTTATWDLNLEKRSSGLVLQLAIDDEDVGFRYADLPLLSAPQQIEVRWRTSSGGGANDGFLCARRIDKEGTSPPGGDPEVCISDVDTDAKTEGRIVFGSVVILDSSVSGEIYLDGFESCLP